MSEKNYKWIEEMEKIQDIRLFSSLYIRKAQKGALSSAQEIDALFRIALGNGNITPLKLSVKMGISKTSISHLIETLTKKNYIHCEKNEEDKRSYCIKLTKQGSIILEKMYLYYIEPLHNLEKTLGKEKSEELLYLISLANKTNS